MESLSSLNLSITYFCLRDVFTKYAWVKPLTNKKAKTVLHGLIEIVNGIKHKPNKLWVDQGIESYNKLMQKWLGNNIF